VSSTLGLRTPVATPPVAALLDARPTELPEVVAFAPRLFSDERGAFAESYRAEAYEAAGVPSEWAQDNAAWSEAGVLRGLHLQHPHAQGKLVTVLAGAVYDVAADVRVGSPTFGRWVGLTLAARGVSQLWVPPGFAHGYLVTEGPAIVTYKCTAPYHPECELTVRWDDPELGVPWPAAAATVSAKDRAGLSLAEAARRGLLPPYAGA
jgi:dTDP-4-dehydrorhamnose 3,5-epimerase